jgi:hypothetical protein
MPPKKGETAHQKVERLQKRAHELQTKVLYNKVVAMLNERPDLLPAVEQTLTSLGAHLGGPATVCPEVTPSKRKASAEPSCMKALEDKASPAHESGSQEIEDSAEGEDDGKFLPKNAASFPTMPVKHIKAILLAIEPVTFSTANMKGMMARGARDVGRAELLKLLEFCTNVAPTSTVAPEHKDVAVLHAYMQVLNKELGRRARDLTFPVNWEAQGIYTVQMLEGKPACAITRNDTKEECQVAIPIDVKSVFVDCNWSELRATVRQHDGYWQQSCALLFAGGFATPTKRGRVSLPSPRAPQQEDGAGLPKTVTAQPEQDDEGKASSVCQLGFQPAVPAGMEAE